MRNVDSLKTIDWQPIETATKDTDILVYNAITGIYRTRYIAGQFLCGFWTLPGVWFPVSTHWADIKKLNTPEDE